MGKIPYGFKLKDFRFAHLPSRKSPSIQPPPKPKCSRHWACGKKSRMFGPITFKTFIPSWGEQNTQKVPKQKMHKGYSAPDPLSRVFRVISGRLLYVIWHGNLIFIKISTLFIIVHVLNSQYFFFLMPISFYHRKFSWVLWIHVELKLILLNSQLVANVIIFLLSL